MTTGFSCLRQRANRRRAVRGFTLLELLVVLGILGLLVGYVAPRCFGHVGKSEVKVAKAQIRALEDRSTSTGWMSGITRPPSRAWRRWTASPPARPAGRGRT